MRAIRIDRSKPLAEEPHTGHNRYHPDIEPVLEVAEDEEVILETRDAIDGQLSGTATEAAFANMNVGAVHPLTERHAGLATERKFQAPVFTREDYFIDPKYAAPQRFLGVMGMPLRADGENEGENLTLACRNAVLNMMELLQERGFTRNQAYVICSVAVDLRISNVVDVPNYVVSALLPEAIFG